MTRKTTASLAPAAPTLAGAGPARDKPDEPSSNHFNASDGVKTHHLVQGKGTPAVLTHGHTGSAEGNRFRNGTAQEPAKNHAVVALDCRNHGKSDKPQPGGPGRAEDVIELMDHLKLTRAHPHGYSTGGAIVARLTEKAPDRFLTAGFGGPGVPETDGWRDEVPPDREGKDPKEAEAGRALRVRAATDRGKTREEAGKPADAKAKPRPAAGRPAPPKPDLTKVTFPVLAINGEFDRPNAKTHRPWREPRNFTNVVPPGKSHLTAVAAPHMPKEYLESVVKLINANDPKD